MPKIKSLAISIFSIILLVSCKSEAKRKAERNAIIDSTIVNFEKKLLENQIDSVFGKYHFNGSIGIYKNNEVVYKKEKGYQDFKNKIKLNDQSVFAIGSASKQFTAVLVLLQQEAGKLKTTDQVSKYLPNFQTKDLENITIHQLLNHSSGLNDAGENLLFKSGAGFNYSNKGFRFLGEIIEKVSGKSYDENAKALFAKAGMKNTYTADFFEGENSAGAYDGTTNNYHEIENMPKRLSEKGIGSPAGGILSTINDLKNWNIALFGGKILKPETLQKMLDKSSLRKEYIMDDVGYCYGIMTNLEKPKAYFHTGYVKGSASLLAYYPDTKTSVVILSNIADDSKGSSYIFKPHVEIKKMTDALQNSVIDLRREMLK